MDVVFETGGIHFTGLYKAREDNQMCIVETALDIPVRNREPGHRWEALLIAPARKEEGGKRAGGRVEFWRDRKQKSGRHGARLDVGT